jgi:hypothetical protein
MACKTCAYKVHAQTLVIAQQCKAKLQQNSVSPSRDQGHQDDVDCHAGQSSILEDDITENHPEERGSHQSDEPMDEPIVVDVNDEDLLDLDAGAIVSDSLLDGGLSDQSNDTNIAAIEVSDLQRFATVLQEAQHCANQLELEKGKEKKKTYLDNSKTTHYHHAKTHKDLAAQGFLDIKSFLALKKEEAERTLRMMSQLIMCKTETPILAQKIWLHCATPPLTQMISLIPNASMDTPLLRRKKAWI